MIATAYLYPEQRRKKQYPVSAAAGFDNLLNPKSQM
jgi:hypothetical protein